MTVQGRPGAGSAVRPASPPRGTFWCSRRPSYGVDSCGVRLATRTRGAARWTFSSESIVLGRLVIDSWELLVTISLSSRWRQAAGAAALAAIAATGLTACGDDANASSGGDDGVALQLGYFPNLTHGTALVGIEQGLYEEKLSEDGSTVQFAEFDSGSDTITALLNGDLAATYIGPVPALTAYTQSKNVTVLAGAASGGAALVVSDDVSSVDDLEGKTIATPGEFNTQDIAARAYFKEQGYEINPDG